MKKLNFKGMGEAVVRAFDMVATNQWTQTKARYYLQTEGINTLLAEHCIKYANNRFKLSGACNDDPDYDELYQQYTDSFKEFEIPNFPSM